MWKFLLFFGGGVFCCFVENLHVIETKILALVCFFLFLSQTIQMREWHLIFQTERTKLGSVGLQKQHKTVKTNTLLCGQSSITETS